MTRHYCTYFDHRYLPRALALVQSLEAHATPFHLWVLCLDGACSSALKSLKLPHLTPLDLAELEEENPDLVSVKPDRSPAEYYFTCSPFLPLYLFSRHPDIDLLTYLDADLYFYSTPEPLFHEMAGGAVAIIGHRYPENLRSELEQFGRFNVGWISYRRDPRAFDVLRWWKERCLEWCFDRVELGRFADQKYLDEWPARFPGTVILQHEGANLAPWNLVRYDVTSGAGGVQIDGRPLIFFHFHGLKQLGPRIYNPQLKRYGVKSASPLLRSLYRDYLDVLQSATRLSRPHLPQAVEAPSIRGESGRPGGSPRSLGRQFLSRTRGWWRLAKGTITREYILAPRPT